jgi:F-type H+-transporting ATPase subunit alpha
VLKQGQYQPMPVQEQIAILWAATNGFLEDVPVDQVQGFEAAYLDNLRTAHANLLEQIAKEKALSDELIAALRKATEDFKAGSQWASKTPVAAAAR